MLRNFFFLIFFIISIATCGFSQTNVTKTITAGGKTHSCIWHVPGGISNPAVVFFIHGANGSGGNFQTETKADVVADKEKFIAVYPSATNNGNTGIWADMRGTSDFPFYQAVIDTLDALYKIDRDRVYMTGFSQGGFISFVAGCSFSDIFAAVAPVSGHAASPCTLKRPVSVFMTFGSQEGAESFFQDRDIWLKLNKCPSTPTRTKPYPSTNPQSSVTRLSYGPCDEGTYVIVDSIGDQGHQWPTKLNQAEEVWAFFKQFTLKNNNTPVNRYVNVVNHEQVSASYNSGVIRMQGIKDNTLLKITDTRGRLITSGLVTQNQFAFKNHSSGMYMVTAGDNHELSMLRILVP